MIYLVSLVKQRIELERPFEETKLKNNDGKALLYVIIKGELTFGSYKTTCRKINTLQMY